MRPIIWACLLGCLLVRGELSAAPHLVPGVISVSKILENSKAQKGLAADFNKQQTTFQTEINGLEKELRAKEVNLKEKEKTLSEKDFIVARQTFERRVQEVQGIVELRRKQLIAARTIAFAKVQEALRAAAKKVVDKKEVNLLLVDTQVFLAAPTFDLTDDVLKELDNSLPQVPLEVPQEDAIKAEEAR